MEFHTVVIGTGFSGLGMAIRLKQDGHEDFVVLEKADDVGGTWRDNTYPGCACDVQSHMYSFSFAQNPRWTRSFSPQQEIWEYLREITDRYRLREHIRFGVEVEAARWDEDELRWHVTTSAGEYTARFLVMGIGGLHIPNIPALPGIERFQGVAFHSARWNHDYDLTGKRVAVVGTGASAIQFVPRIAPDVAELTVFQRTPPWILPKPDHPMPGWAKTLFRLVPGAQRLYRNTIYWLLEARALGFNGHPRLMGLAARVALATMHRAVKDPELRRKLTPDYVMGCKRVLLANDYYPALTRDNVEVNTTGIRAVTEHGVVDGDGTEHEVDAIIYGTGFHATDASEYHLDVTGAGGRDLAKEWRESGLRTHLGITVAGFPNLFFLLGPNTGLGHNSVVFMIESQIRYVAQAMALADRTGAAALDTKESAQAEFQSDLQRRLAAGVWTRGGCKSWYLDAHGVNRTIWPGFTWRYWLRTRSLDPSVFELVG
jgi:cation diffusion facilitator CzcD-associated flavoprotein CzcO